MLHTHRVRRHQIHPDTAENAATGHVKLELFLHLLEVPNTLFVLLFVCLLLNVIVVEFYDRFLLCNWVPSFILRLKVSEPRLGVLRLIFTRVD